MLIGLIIGFVVGGLVGSVITTLVLRKKFGELLTVLAEHVTDTYDKSLSMSSVINYDMKGEKDE